SDAHGSPDARHAMASFLQRYITKTAVSKDHIILQNGACTVINSLATLLCDAEEHVMVFGPGYRGFEGDVKTHANANITVAHLDKHKDGSSLYPPVHTVSAMQDALDQASADGNVVRAVIVCSPHNPTGELLDEQLIRDIVTWGRSNSLHVVFDELYALSVHDPKASFTSVAEVLQGDLGDDVHIVWSMSKDLCSSGMRLGALYSQNERLRMACIINNSMFGWASRVAEWPVISLLSDFGWVDSFIAENNRRLREAYERSVEVLEKLNVPYVPASAGFFILADFRRFLPEATKEAEHELFLKLWDAKVVVTPSAEFFASSYGFFRICFAAAKAEEMEVAWSRIRSVLL
ncbi:MAG: aminotransferase class I/II-fold pyridoxal phosphate-dependent enzyme, partial [Myxococcota bacterium]